MEMIINIKTLLVHQNHLMQLGFQDHRHSKDYGCLNKPRSLIVCRILKRIKSHILPIYLWNKVKILKISLNKQKLRQKAFTELQMSMTFHPKT